MGRPGPRLASCGSVRRVLTGFGPGVLVLAIALGACVTPSIPVPPPDATRMTFAVDPTQGTATFSYPSATPGAIVYVFNRNAGQGVIDTARADGTVGPTAPFPAAVGDQLDVSFQVDDQLVSTCVRLGDGSPASLGFCIP